MCNVTELICIQNRKISNDLLILKPFYNVENNFELTNYFKILNFKYGLICKTYLLSEMKE